MTTQTLSPEITSFMTDLRERHPGETEFHQAVEEVAESVFPFIKANPVYEKANVFGRLENRWLGCWEETWPHLKKSHQYISNWPDILKVALNLIKYSN